MKNIKCAEDFREYCVFKKLIYLIVTDRSLLLSNDKRIIFAICEDHFENALSKNSNILNYIKIISEKQYLKYSVIQ